MPTQIATADFDESGFDPSQFVLQADGTFRISIRATALAAGIHHSGIVRSLASAGDENPLPLARSLAAQGFSAGDMLSWGQSGGIPETGFVAAMQHYGFTSATPSRQASDTLLAFASVGINAYLREKLGVSQVRDTQPALTQAQFNINWLLSLESHGIKFDARDMLQIKEACVQLALPAAGETTSLYRDIPVSRAVFEVLGVKPSLGQLSQIGRHLKRWYKEERGVEPVKHDQYVDGANREVNTYPRDWIEGTLARLAKTYPHLFSA